MNVRLMVILHAAFHCGPILFENSSHRLQDGYTMFARDVFWRTDESTVPAGLIAETSRHPTREKSRDHKQGDINGNTVAIIIGKH